MAQKTQCRSIQSLLDECTQILEDIRVLDAEDKWNDPLFGEDQEWVSNLDPDSASDAKRKLAALGEMRFTRSDSVEPVLVMLTELVEGGGDELIAQLRQSNPPYTYDFMLPQIKGARRLAQATIGAEEVLLKDMNEGVQDGYWRTLIFAQKNYARLEGAYHKSRTLLSSLEALRSKALDEEDED